MEKNKYLDFNGLKTYDILIKKYTDGKVDIKQDNISDLDEIRTGASLGATALQSVPEEYVTETELTDKGYATVTYVNEKVADLVDGAPETLDTLDELSAALKDNKDIVDVLTNSIGVKQDKVDDLETIRSGAALGATALQSVPEEYVTESELQTELSKKSDKDHTHSDYLAKTVYYGDVLYNVTSPNFNSSITISGNLSNYKFIDIEFATDDGHISHSRIYEPNGKIVTLTVSLCGQASFFMKSRTYEMTNNTFSTAMIAGTGSNSGKMIPMAGLWGTHEPTLLTRGETFIGICKIVGYK